MGGCAAKPVVLKEEGAAPKTAEDPTADTDAGDAGACPVDNAAKDVTGGEESKEEAVESRKSLSNSSAEKEVEEEKTKEEEEKDKTEQEVEEKPVVVPDEQQK